MIRKKYRLQKRQNKTLNINKSSIIPFLQRNKFYLAMHLIFFHVTYVDVDLQMQKNETGTSKERNFKTKI